MNYLGDEPITVTLDMPDLIEHQVQDGQLIKKINLTTGEVTEVSKVKPKMISLDPIAVNVQSSLVTAEDRVYSDPSKRVVYDGKKIITIDKEEPVKAPAKAPAKKTNKNFLWLLAIVGTYLATR